MDNQLLHILSQALSAIAVAVLPVLAAYLAKAVKAWIVAKTAELEAENPSLMYWLEWAAKLAVDAAESAGLNGWIEDKKKFALDLVEKILRERGFEIDLDVIAAAIEAAWLEAYGQEKLRAANCKE